MASPAESSPFSVPNSAGDGLTYATILLNMLESREWETFELVALKKPLAFQFLNDVILSSEEYHGVTFLHAAVRYSPPFDIIDQIVKICPNSPRACDCLNRTPLHVAVGTGASIEVINYLVSCYPEACNVQDEDGRTPLHFECDSESVLFEGDQGGRGPPSLAVVSALLLGSIRAASMEDEDGTSPIEYAILSNASVRVVKVLQQAAQMYLRRSAKAEQLGSSLRSNHQGGTAA
jgi:ankyrin repeat protein